MPPASSAADVHSTARRFGAYDRTTNLLNESTNQPILLLTDAHRSLYEAATLKTALKLSSILSIHALAQSTARGHGRYLVRRPILLAAPLCLSRGCERSDRRAALRNHGAAPVRHHDHRRRGQRLFWRPDADRVCRLS